MLNVFRRKLKTLPAGSAYDLWASTYHQESNPVRDLNNRTIESWLPPLNGMTVLDIGCGTGYFCELALNRGAKRVYGIDISKEMLRQSIVRFHRHSNVMIGEGSAEYLIFKNDMFDLVISSLVYGHVKNLMKCFDEVARVLDSNGIFIFSDFHPDIAQRGAKRTFRNPTDKRTYAIEHYLHSKQEYFKLLEQRHFSIQTVYEPVWSGDQVVLAIKAKKLK